MKESIAIVVVVFLSSVLAQFPFSFSLTLSPELKKAKGIGAFVNLWEFSLREDVSQRIAENTILEPKTLIAPDDLAMVHLIPQDASHPLYLQDKKHSDLRREFLFSHLVLEPLSPTESQVSTPEGIMVTTLSGKSVLIRKSKLGELTVEGVKVLDVVKLTDGIHVYRLKEPLFNLRQKVRDAFDIIHGIGSEDPVGPPLIIPQPFSTRNKLDAMPPAPPFHEDIKPPAVPSKTFLQNVNTAEDDVLPPAIPAHFTLNTREQSIVSKIDLKPPV